MKRLACLILAMAMLLALAACGGEPDPHAGVYEAQSAEMSGIIDYAGQMGQHAYENYTVTRQTQDTLVWKDMYGDNRTFVKVR